MPRERDDLGPGGRAGARKGRADSASACDARRLAPAVPQTARVSGVRWAWPDCQEKIGKGVHWGVTSSGRLDLCKRPSKID